MGEEQARIATRDEPHDAITGVFNEVAVGRCRSAGRINGQRTPRAVLTALAFVKKVEYFARGRSGSLETQAYALVNARAFFDVDLNKFAHRDLPVASPETFGHSESVTSNERIQKALLAWYRKNARDLPWRRTQDPYAIWLSEVMLQQTRVDTVIPYFDRFLKELPNVEALAEATEDKVISLWSGLGYYRRARMLHEGAKAIARQPFPRTATALREVKGIGRYTAGAVASIAFGEVTPLVDGNVARVFSRLFGIDDDLRKPKGMDRIWSIAGTIVAKDDPGSWNQALMELGATVCVPRAPRCLICPLAKECHAHANGREHELPVMSAKRAPTVQSRVALALLADDGDVLLARRNESGIFAGMWEMPSIELQKDETPEACAKRLSRSLGASCEAVALRGEVVHVLTHRRLEVSVWGAALRSFSPPRPTHLAEYDTVALMSRDEGAKRTKSTYGKKLMKMGFPTRSRGR